MKLQTSSVDLSNCDREPIHQLGMIQNFGGLVAIDSDWLVSHRSANVSEMLGREDEIELGSRLSSIFSKDAFARIRSGAAALAWPDQVERIFGLALCNEDRLFDCAIHSTKDNLVIIEIEPHSEGELNRQLGILRPTMNRLRQCETVEALTQEAARSLRLSLDIDRVMVYRFRDDLSGEVVAEAKRDDLEAFYGLRYPKTDIPSQARALYVRNRFRIISDIDADPVPIDPGTDIDGRPLDLSMSALRSVSPIHIEYLRNMGVGASLSISIIIDGKLWGLFACHHYSAKLLPYSQRTTAELFSELFSLMLERVIGAQNARLSEQGRELHDRLMRDIAAGTSLAESLPTLDIATQAIIPHDGASVCIDGVYDARGAAPNEEEFRALLPGLVDVAATRVFSSDALANNIPAAQDFANRAVGALVIPVSRTPRDYLVLWRRELPQTVNWAGKPEKPVEYGPNGPRLTPRKSFEAWQESVRGRSEAWSEAELKIAEGLRVTLLEIILRLTDEAVQERAAAQQQQELLIAELNHRVRNILNLIRGLIGQSKREAADIDSFAEIIGGRIGSLALAHDNITKGNWSSAPLRELIDSEVHAYLSAQPDRMVIEGPEAMIKPEAYTVLALVIHEMMTNSAKYGSLSEQSGSLKITTERNQTDDLEIHWRETGGPPVKPPGRRGFGSTIIEQSIPFELGGQATIEYKLSGVQVRLCIPARYIEWRSGSGEKTMDSAVADNSGGIGSLPKSVLLVEDSMIIALDTEDNLREIGIGKVMVESSVAGALDTLEKNRPGLAILDYNLGTENSERVAEELARMGVPFWLATGYGELEDRIRELGAAGVLTKPYGREELAKILREFSPPE